MRRIYVSPYVELTVEMRSINISLSTEICVEAHSIYVSTEDRTHCVGAQYPVISTEITVELRSIYVSPVYRTHCGGAQYLYQSCVQNSFWMCAVYMSIKCTKFTLEVRSVSVILCTEPNVEVRSIYVGQVYTTHCGVAQYLCQSCVQNSVCMCALSMSLCVQSYTAKV